MARITKNLPPNRADYTFGDLVYWHVLRYGTRPNGDPGAEMGRPWETEAICRLLDITHRTLRNWINDRNMPDSAVPLCIELFGDNPRWDGARAEFLEKFEQAWARKNEKKTVRETIIAATGRALVLFGGTRKPEPEIHLPAGPIFGKSSEIAGKAHEKSFSGGPLITIEPVQAYYKPKPPPSPPQPNRRRLAAMLVPAVLLVAGGTYFSLRSSAKPTPPTQTTEKRLPDPSPEPPPPLTKKADAGTTGPVTNRPASEEERRAAEERRLIEQTIADRKAGFDTAKRQQERDAVLRDQEEQAAGRAQADRDQNGRNIAGMGYRLRENATVTGQSIGPVPVDSVTDCALACLKDNCDAFAFQRQTGAASNAKHACYRYRKPFELSANTFYVSGERVADSEATPTPVRAGLSDMPTTQVAQATLPPAKADNADGVVQCPNGPVKVTGFKITCDRILSGGTTLGSAQLSYTVANINECAAKCRPINRCVGFTFNAADPPGRQACTIFGPTPEGRQSGGWIAGTR